MEGSEGDRKEVRESAKEKRFSEECKSRETGDLQLVRAIACYNCRSTDLLEDVRSAPEAGSGLFALLPQSRTFFGGLHRLCLPGCLAEEGRVGVRNL